MKYRKLRIAWSVAWGVVAVLLCVLWVRSYGIVDYTGWAVSGQGKLYFSATVTVRPIPDRNAYPAESHSHFGGRLQILSTSNVEAVPSPGTPTIPYWAFVLLTCLLTGAFWIGHFPRQFSLRTLLIATTLIAVVLGIIVWMMRAG
jgi:hypothetical protein